MDRKSTEQLRLDRRLTGRKNWINPKDFERELQALPDASHKIAPVEEKPEPGSTDEKATEGDSLESGAPISDPPMPPQS